jgi:hypothetical protein
MFWEVIIDNESAKILSLWFNSTLGLLTLLSKSINNKGTWFNLKKNQLMNVPTLDTRTIAKSDKAMLLDLFNEIKNERFKCIPEEMLSAAHNEGTRKRIDDAFCDILDINFELKRFYEMLAKDPIFSNQRI